MRCLCVLIMHKIIPSGVLGWSLDEKSFNNTDVFQHFGISYLKANETTQNYLLAPLSPFFLVPNDSIWYYCLQMIASEK